MTAALRELKQEREEAREEGAILENLKAIQKKLQKGKDYATTFDEMEIEDEHYFEELWELIQNYPDYSAEELLDVYLEK